MFTKDIHNEYVNSDGSLVWGFTELDVDADIQGMDDVIVATCADCGGQMFTSCDEDDVWVHLSDMGCDSQFME